MQCMLCPGQSFLGTGHMAAALFLKLASTFDDHREEDAQAAVISVSQPFTGFLAHKALVFGPAPRNLHGPLPAAHPLPVATSNCSEGMHLTRR